MKVLIAGTNSYIGTCLIPVLLEKGYKVVCLVRDKNHFYKQTPFAGKVTITNGDLLRRQSIERLPADIDTAYYLVNPFTQTLGFAALEALSAQNFISSVNQTNCRQIITLTEIINHSTARESSRYHVESILSSGKAALTILKTTMIVGAGSLALEMFNALTAKTPILIAKKWAKVHSQPISTNDVLGYLENSLLNEQTFNRKFDIGGPEILLFKQMLLIYIAIYKNFKPSFKPSIVTLPFLTAKLSSGLLNLLNPISYPTAQTLVENLKNDTICEDNSIKDIIPRKCLTFKQSLRLVSDFSS